MEREKTKSIELQNQAIEHLNQSLKEYLLYFKLYLYLFFRQKEIVTHLKAELELAWNERNISPNYSPSTNNNNNNQTPTPLDKKKKSKSLTSKLALKKKSNDEILSSKDNTPVDNDVISQILQKRQKQ